MIRAQIIKADTVETVSVQTGTRLSDILGQEHSFDLPCGGKQKCKRCSIRVQGQLSEPEEIERATFSQEQLADGWRLACVSRALGDVRIYPELPVFDAICTDAVMPQFSEDSLDRRYGVAADIGTTTVCIQLYGPDGLLESVSMKNPQTAFGADVISRIERSMSGERAALAACIRRALSELICRALEKADVRAEKIDFLVLTGNTTMLYLLTERDPEALSHAPFQAGHLFGEYLPADEFFPELGLRKEVQAYLPRCMSAFVGADITTALLASGLCAREESGMLVDIGTNGEIALWHEKKLYVCSTAAGPAFEGVGMSCGVYGVRGAVDKVWLSGDAIRYSTISGKKPVGICGSGAVDAIAVMLHTEQIDETGTMTQTDVFDIAPNVFINGQDVRKMQLAKGAIRAGLETLLRHVGIDWDELSSFSIAGGFGRYLNLNSAAEIGLIPQSILPRTQVIGNAALAGAAILLRNRNYVAYTQELAEQAHTIALDANPEFMEQFMLCMMFGADDAARDA